MCRLKKTCKNAFESKQNEKMFSEIYSFEGRVLEFFSGRMSVMVRTKKISWGFYIFLVGIGCILSHAADVRPFYFENVTADASIQQEEWEKLMKYKLWGTYGMYFTNEGAISIEDTTGYNGTATGNLDLANSHHIGGPFTIGGDVKFTALSDVQLLGGPFHTLGGVELPAWQYNALNGDGATARFDGPYCIKGDITGPTAEGDNTVNLWKTKISKGVYQGDDYSQCPETVPEVDPLLSIPTVDYSGVTWEKGVVITSYLHPQVQFIHVPPDSVYTNEYGTYDKYIDSLKVSAQTNFKLYVLMPPEGRLTRIFVRDGFDIDNSAHSPRIQVVYAPEGAKFDRKAFAWDTTGFTDSSKFTYITSETYAGNLMFYTTKVVNWASTDNPEYQGTFMTTDSMYIGNDFSVAGQLLAKYLRVRAPYTGNFRYVPFDPPVVDLDPTALASGKFLENDLAQEIPIHLSKTPTTVVSFNYCFVLSDEADNNSMKLANAADFNTTGMPLCTVNSDGTITGDSATITFNAGSTLPTSATYITPVTDKRVEGDESFKIYVFNMSGAVLSGNKRTGFFTLYIKDADSNLPPEFSESSYDFTINENSSVKDSAGFVSAVDKNAGDIPKYYISSGDSSIFTVDASTGKITVKKAVLDYESKDTTYTIYVYATDGLLYSDTVPVTIHVKDVNEKPTLADTTFKVSEQAAIGDVVGTLDAFDPDSLNVKYSTLTYKVISSSAANVFDVDASTGTITVLKSLDYEKSEVYVLVVQVSDGTYSDTATVTISVIDENEAPVAEKTTVTINEECSGCSASEKVKATDPENDPLTYKIVSDTSGIFKMDSTTGIISLKKNERLDYEKDSVYTVKVSVTDPSGLSDTTTVTIRVKNMTEDVEITYAEAGDSSWTKPDTVYTNQSTIYIKWQTPDGEKDSTVVLTEGKNVITVNYQDGSDQIIVYLSTKVPVVTVSASNDTSGRASGVTIVEQKDPSDTASYVRSENALITVSVVDSSGEKAQSAKTSFKIVLDTATVTASNIKTVEKTIGKVNLKDEVDLSSSVKVTHTVIGENRIQVSYYDTTSAGTVVLVSYYTDANGKRLTDENGEEYYEVSTTFTDADGKVVSLTYTIDATGTVKTDSAGNTVYTVSYTYEATGTDKKTTYDVTVAYTINSKGDKTYDEDGNMIYTVSYTYTDVYGNSATANTVVIVDTVPPKVEIISPEDSSVVSNVSIAVKWMVNGVDQDTLNYQGLNDGKNLIIRTYRDKAGNEASDTVIVILKAGKLITVEMEDPLVSSNPKTVDKFTSVSNSEPGTVYALSVVNAKTGKEEELQAGSKNGVSEGSGEEPYTGLTGQHLGATLSISAQAPAIDETGTLSTLGSIVENGYVALDSGGGWDRTTTTVEDYVENYCSTDFQKAYDSLGTAASLYATKVNLKIWLFSTIGEYVADFGFTQEIIPDFVDESGAIQLYFELKPDEDGYLKTPDGRKIGTGAYIYNSDVKIRSVLQCDLPDHKKGYIRKDDDRILTKWGYRRPTK